MKIEKTPFDDLWIVQPTVLDDPRGYFFEVFNQEQFKQETNLNIHFVQDNESMSSRGVLRGLHFQIPPMSQAKWVRVSQGAVHDVVVDLRRTKRTFGKSFQIVLSAENKTQLFIPEGFAHGFYALEDQSIFTYKCSNYYSKEHERTMLWNDAELNIDWGVKEPLISDKDKKGLPLSACRSFFI